MGLFDKLRGSADTNTNPAPPCEIHENDRDLVQSEDLAWWSSLSLQDCVALEQEDNTFKLAAFQKFKEQGLDSAEAAKRVRLAFLYFYTRLSKRMDEQFALPDQDALLPYPLKDRINRAMIAGKVSRDEFAQASSANALVRQKIRNGEI